MSKGPGVDPAVARRVDDAGFDVALPSETPVRGVAAHNFTAPVRKVASILCLLG